MNMRKHIVVKDLTTGEVEFNEELDDGYALQYSKRDDDGRLHGIGQIANGKFDHKHWIKNYEYAPLAQKLIDKFEELAHIKVKRILFIEDHVSFENKSLVGGEWSVQVKKASKELTKLWGYWYVFTIRQHVYEQKTPEQRVAIFYHELRHIGELGDLKDHDIEDFCDMIDTLGRNWQDTTSEIFWNILDDNFTWGQLRRQLTLFESNKQVN